VVDYHVHVFSQDLLNNLKDQGLNISKNIFESDCKDAECTDLEKLRINNFDKMVLISAPYAIKLKEDLNNQKLKYLVEKENDFLHSIVKQDHKNLYGFCGINPTWNFSLEEVKRCIEVLKMDGIKFHFQGNQIDLNDSLIVKRIQDILLYLSLKNKPVLIHLNGADLTNGSEMAQGFINSFLENKNRQTIIFAHSGGAGGLYKLTVDVLNEFHIYFKANPFSKHKTIYFELSGTILEHRYPGKLESMELVKLIDKLGIEHFLFGSDHPFRMGKNYLRSLNEALNFNQEKFKIITTKNIFDAGHDR